MDGRGYSGEDGSVRDRFLVGRKDNECTVDFDE
jgi:hypothetical protein